MCRKHDPTKSMNKVEKFDPMMDPCGMPQAAENKNVHFFKQRNVCLIKRTEQFK